MTKETHYISTNTIPIDTKRGRMEMHFKRLLPLKPQTPSRDQCEVTMYFENSKLKVRAIASLVSNVLRQLFLYCAENDNKKIRLSKPENLSPLAFRDLKALATVLTIRIKKSKRLEMKVILCGR